MVRIARTSPELVGAHTLLNNWSWVTTRPALTESSKSSLYSVAVSFTGLVGNRHATFGVVNSQVAQHVEFQRPDPVRICLSVQGRPNPCYQFRRPRRALTM